MKRTELLFGFLRLPIDFLTTFSAFLLAYRLRKISDFIPYFQFTYDINIFPSWENYKILATIASGLFILILAFYKGYSFKNTTRFIKEIKLVFSASIIWLMTIISYYFIIHEFPFSRLTLAYSWFIALVFVCAGRFILKITERILLKQNIGKRRMLIIGNNLITKEIYNVLKKNPTYKIIGIIDDNGEKFEGKMKSIGKISDFKKIIKDRKIEEIIQTKSNLKEMTNLDILNYCRTNHIQYHFVPDLLEVHHTNIDVSLFSGLPLITMKPTALDGWGKILKRVFDIIISIFGLIILSPILAILAILIRIDSKGPIFFSKLEDKSKVMRVGQFGRLFHFIKFRTMKPNTHHLRYTKLAEKNIRTDGPLVKIKNDPRITKFGKFLRETSLDELPQLWTVLKGNMSLVGPRPHLPEEVAKYKDYQKFVLEIKPGITGLAQINGRSDLTFDEEVRLDTYYIEHWNLMLDLKILLRTIFVIFKKYQE